MPFGYCSSSAPGLFQRPGKRRVSSLLYIQAVFPQISSLSGGFLLLPANRLKIVVQTSWPRCCPASHMRPGLLQGSQTKAPLRPGTPGMRQDGPNNKNAMFAKIDPFSLLCHVRVHTNIIQHLTTAFSPGTNHG